MNLSISTNICCFVLIKVVLQEHSAVVYSDNHGATWSFANTSLVGAGTTESEVVQLQHSPNTLMFKSDFC